MDKPWHMVLYCDETEPGEQLGGHKLRKFHATYYSFMEFGAAALSCEDLWFTLSTQRSLVVSRYPGKLAVVCGAILLSLFVDGPMSDIGFELNYLGIKKRMIVKVGVFIMDGAAHKAVWHCKGDAGNTLCILDKKHRQLAVKSDRGGRRQDVAVQRQEACSARLVHLR